MLARAAARVGRLAPARSPPRAAAARGSSRGSRLRAIAFSFAVAAFHSIQHLATDRELARFFAGVARTLAPGGWLAFDTFAPNAQFLGRANARRRPALGADAVSGTRRPAVATEYSESYRLDGTAADDDVPLPAL